MKKDHDSLARLNSILKTVSRVNQLLLTSDNENKLCHDICNNLAKIKGYKFVWLGLKERNSTVITPLAFAGDSGKILMKSIKTSWKKYSLDGSPIRKVLDAGVPFVVRDLKEEEKPTPWDYEAVKLGLESALILPISYYSKTIGILHIYSDAGNYFSKDEIKFLNEISVDISIGVRGLRNEARLSESKKQYEELFRRISSCVAIYEARDNGKDFIFRDLNKAVEKIEKVKREEIIGKSVLKVFPGVRDFGLFDVFRRVYRTGISENHPISIYRDNRITGWRENFVYKLPSGEVVAVYNDLTDKKKAEEDIKVLARFLEENPSPVIRTDYEGKILYCNRACLEKNISGAFRHSNHLPMPLLEEVKKLSSGRSWRQKNLTVAIESRIFQFSIVPVRKEGYINFYGSDITSLQKAEQAILDSEVRYRDLFESAPVGLAIVDGKGTIKSVNRELIALTGIPKTKLMDKNISVFKSIDFDKILSIVGKGGKIGPFNIKWHNRSGKEITGEVSIVPSKLDKKTRGFQVIIRDITKQIYAENSLKQSYNKLEDTLNATIRALASLVEVKDPYTSGHQERVAKLSSAIAKSIGLGKKDIEAITKAATVHDIGKITVPDSILVKPSTLNELERSLIETHSRCAYDILKDIDFGYPVSKIVLQHHERNDGSGYPDKLKASDIMIESKIVGVADVVEAMSSHRPYRPSLGIKAALKEINDFRGILYEPGVVDACTSLFRKKRFSF